MDSKTLAAALVLVLGSLSVLGWLVARRRKDGALTLWALGLAGSSAGFLILLIQGIAPSPVLLFVGNVLLMGYNLTLPWGLRLFLRAPVHWPHRYTVVLGLWLVCLVLLIFVFPSYPWRVMLTSLCMAFLSFEFFLVLFSHHRGIRRPLKYFLGGLGLFYGGFQLYRAGAAPFWPVDGLSADLNLTSATFLVALAVSILWAGGLLLLDSERLQQMVRDDSVELRRLNLLKDRVLAMTGHDLRGPLGNLRLIWGELGARVREGRTTSLDPELLVLVDRSLAGTQDLLENLFSFAEAQKGGDDRESRALLAVAVSGVLDLWASAAQTKGVTLRHGGGDAPPVAARQDSVAAVLRNLVGNAVKFTPSGGIVTVRIGGEPGAGYFVEVTDTGIGMEPTVLARSQELAEKASRPGTAGERGSGFGLVLVRELVEGWGGSLTFDSAPGRGTRVRVGFPP